MVAAAGRAKAAQAEFYSANLGAEVKRGLEERLRRGLWTSVPPLGYLHGPRGAAHDPARARFITRAFELWSTGLYTSRRLADQLNAEGLLARGGGKVRSTHLCRHLQNPFYTGRLVVKGVEYVGVHPPLVTLELFERAQEVFRQKRGHGKSAKRHLTFLLSGKVPCP